MVVPNGDRKVNLLPHGPAVTWDRSEEKAPAVEAIVEGGVGVQHELVAPLIVLT